MAKKEQNMIKGGQNCGCACLTNPCPCKYAGPQEGPDDSFYGGSSKEDNQDANNNGGFSLALYESNMRSGSNIYSA